MKRLFVCLVILLSFVTISFANIDIINEYYGHHESVTARAVVKNDIIVNYIYKFDNGTMIEFNEDYDITAIVCFEQDTIPYEILPIKIQTYMEGQYPNNKIKQYYKSKELRLVLDNGSIFIFNKRNKRIK